MKLSRRPRRSQPETIVTLINVIFFLLVFFMVIGRMDATAPFSVTPPLASVSAKMPGGGATVSVSETGDLALNGAALNLDTLRLQLADLLAANADLLVRINVHREAELRRFLPLVAQIEAMGAIDIVLVVRPDVPLKREH